MAKKLSDIFGGIFAKGEEPFAITKPFKLIAGRTAADICGDFELKEETNAYLSGEPTPEQFVQRLFRAKLYSDSTQFLAYGLPKRHAVWWACLCVRSVPACCADEISAGAMQATETWVKDPTEANREAAMAAGIKHKFEMPGAPAAWTAMAAGWSAGATATDDENGPGPQEYLTSHATSGAIILAASVDPDRAGKVSRKFLETGVQIAQGGIQISS